MGEPPVSFWRRERLNLVDLPVLHELFLGACATRTLRHCEVEDSNIHNLTVRRPVYDVGAGDRPLDIGKYETVGAESLAA